MAAALIIALFGVAITMGVWSGLQASNDAVIKDAVAAAAEYAQVEIEDRIDARMDALRQLATRWEQFGPTERKPWELDTEMIYRDLPGFQAIEWIDADFVVRWITPLVGNEAAQGLDITFESTRRVAVETARDRRAPSVSRKIELVQGGRGFLVYFPLYRQDVFEGFIVGVFVTQTLFEQVIPQNLAGRFEVAIFEQNELVFEGRGIESPNPRMAAGRVISMPGIIWRLRVTPGVRTARELFPSFARASTVAGIIITLLVAVAVYLALTFWLRRQETQRVNTQLSEEIVRRKHAQQDLREHMNNLGQAVAARTREIAQANTELKREVELHHQAKVALEHNQSRLRHLTLDQSLSEERFRKVIAEKIHDRLSNGLVLAKLRLADLGTDLRAPEGQKIREVNSLLSTIIDDSRSMVFEISPPILFELGLAAAVEWYANSTLAASGLEIDLDLQDEFPDLRPDLAAAMYRAYTELGINVIKHAGATHVRVEVAEGTGFVCIAVSDNGSGIPAGRELEAAASGGSYGLFSIRERFTELGGTMTISTSDLGGARVQIRAPLSEPKETL